MLKKNIIFISYLILFLVFNTNGLYSQSIDTLQAIIKIRKQYKTIINKQIDKILVSEIDNSYKPTQEEMDEAPFAAIEKFLIYYNTTDTFLIRKYKMGDEGGAFSHTIEEVLLWDNKPFFYYKKTYTSWDQVLNESRIYITDGKVIQKLTKESIVPWSELPKEFYDLQTDVPNHKSPIIEDDINDIRFFIYSSKNILKDLKNK